MKKVHDGGWTAGMHDTASGGLQYAKISGKARALPCVRLALAPITKGERADSVCAKYDGDFHPWVYAMAAIHWQRKIPVYAMICRDAFVKELHHHTEAERRILLCDENAFADFIGKELVVRMREDGSEEIAAINSLLERVEKKARSVTPEERDLLRAIESATVTAGDIPTKKAVREIWLAGRLDRSLERFRRVMELTGFGWLPA